MRKYIFYLLLFFLAVSSISNAQVFEDNVAVVSAAVESVSPYPVEPGQDFTVRLRVYNHGSDTARGVVVDYVESEIFQLTGQKDELSIPFNLCAGCSKDNIYYFTVSPGTKSGEYPIVFKTKERSMTDEQTAYVKIVGQPDIIFDAEVIDDYVIPDGIFTVRLTIKNVGTGIARNLKLIPQTNGFVMENSNMIFINELHPGEKIVNNVTIMVSGSAKPGPQAMQFNMYYKDENSNNYELDQSIGIKVVSKVKLDISSVSFNPNPIKAGENVQISVRVENLGEGKADNVVVLIESTSLKGLNKAFIGKLEEDEDAPAYFMMSAGKPGTSDFKITINYTDDLGYHMVTDTIPLVIPLPATGRELILIIIGIAILIVLVVGFIYLQKRKQKN